MPSITYWTRLEPWSRNPDLKESLQAQVRDPLWMLTRQWQMGEFQGEDAGSAAKAALKSRIRVLNRYRDETGRSGSYDNSRPLESVATSEPIAATARSRVKAGLQMQRELVEAGATGISQSTFLEQYRFAPPTEAELSKMDAESRSFVGLLAGDVIDGSKLAQDIVWHAQEEAPVADKINMYPARIEFPARLGLTPGETPRCARAIQEFWAWHSSLYSQPATEGSANWIPSRLEYKFAVSAPHPTQGQTVLVAEEFHGDNLDWPSFTYDPADAIVGDTTNDGMVPLDEEAEKTVVPANLSFKGMPNKRWWKFEDHQVDLGTTQVDKTDLAKLVLLEFAFTQSNDWLMIPFDLRTGSLCRIDNIQVTNVFGETYDVAPMPNNKDWSMFTISERSQGLNERPSTVGDFLFLPPVSPQKIEGEALEEVRFIRDEMSNLAWAIEATLESELNKPISAFKPVPPAPRVSNTTPPVFRLASDVPENWIPFIAVRVESGPREIQLERAEFLPSSNGPDTRPIHAQSLILRPGSGRYRVFDEEIPREGVSVVRRCNYARWQDGTAHVWMSRRKTAGRGEGASGLRFDTLSGYLPD